MKKQEWTSLLVEGLIPVCAMQLLVSGGKAIILPGMINIMSSHVGS